MRDNSHAEAIKNAACVLFALTKASTTGLDDPAAEVARDAVVRHVAEVLGVAATPPAPEPDLFRARVRRIVTRLRGELGGVEPPGPLTTGYDMALEYAIKLLVTALDGKEPEL